MGSFKPHTFDPLELEILDLVYQAAWAQLIARDPNRNLSKDGRRQSALRKRIFACAGVGSVDFDDLCDKVLLSMPQSWTAARPPSRRDNPYS